MRLLELDIKTLHPHIQSVIRVSSQSITSSINHMCELEVLSVIVKTAMLIMNEAHLI